MSSSRRSTLAIRIFALVLGVLGAVSSRAGAQDWTSHQLKVDRKLTTRQAVNISYGRLSLRVYWRPDFRISGDYETRSAALADLDSIVRVSPSDSSGFDIKGYYRVDIACGGGVSRNCFDRGVSQSNGETNAETQLNVLSNASLYFSTKKLAQAAADSIGGAIAKVKRPPPPRDSAGSTPRP